MRAPLSSGPQYDNPGTLMRASLAQYYSEMLDQNTKITPNRFHGVNTELPYQALHEDNFGLTNRNHQRNNDETLYNTNRIYKVEQEDVLVLGDDEILPGNSKVEERDFFPATPTEEQQLDLIKVKPVMEQNNLCAATPLSNSLNKFLEGSELTSSEVDQLLKKTLVQMELAQNCPIKEEQGVIKEEFDTDWQVDHSQGPQRSYSMVSVLNGPYMKFTVEELSKLDLVRCEPIKPYYKHLLSSWYQTQK